MGARPSDTEAPHKMYQFWSRVSITNTPEYWNNGNSEIKESFLHEKFSAQRDTYTHTQIFNLI